MIRPGPKVPPKQKNLDTDYFDSPPYSLSKAKVCVFVSPAMTIASDGADELVLVTPPVMITRSQCGHKVQPPLATHCLDTKLDPVTITFISRD